jgi:hypothetical protein
MMTLNDCYRPPGREGSDRTVGLRVDGNIGLSPEIIDGHNVTAWLLRELPLLV